MGMENKPLEILIIEDNQGDFILVKEYLRDSELDYRLDWAKDLKSGIESLKNKRFDVVLLDIGLPDSTGINTVGKVLVHCEDTAMIVITGNTDQQRGITAMKFGAQDYIVKENLSDQLLERTIRYSLERKKNEKILVQKNQELKEANAEKDRFFSIIAHDLRSPFNAILGYLDLLNEEYDNYTEPERRKFISSVLKSANNTFSFIENLLEWSRSQRGHIKYEPVEISIQAIIDQVKTVLSGSAEKKKIEIISAVSDNSIAFADYNMIYTVMRNLISNAIKFSYAGGNVFISDSGNDDSVYISIKDKGTGMSQQVVEKLFKIDEKVQESGTAKEKGTGLGLILCKEFIERNKGTIRVKSEEGKGSEFIIELPASENRTI
jgi:signal transduction histidine kinase